MSTRITPRLPDSDDRLDDPGYLARRRLRSDQHRRRRKKRRGRQAGLDHPLARQPLVRARPRRVRRVPRKPNASATRAASTTGRSPTAITPSTGQSAAAASTAATDASSSWNRTATAASRQGRPAVTPIGGKGQLDAKVQGRIAERSKLITGRRRKNQDPPHLVPGDFVPGPLDRGSPCHRRLTRSACHVRAPKRDHRISVVRVPNSSAKASSKVARRPFGCCSTSAAR